MDRQITMPLVQFKTYFCSMLSAKKRKHSDDKNNYRHFIRQVQISVNFMNVFLISFCNTCNYSNGSQKVPNVRYSRI